MSSSFHHSAFISSENIYSTRSSFFDGDDGIDFQVDKDGRVLNKESLFEVQKKIYIKHHRVRGMIVEAIPYSEYIKVAGTSSVKIIFESLCSTYEESQQMKKAKDVSKEEKVKSTIKKSLTATWKDLDMSLDSEDSVERDKKDVQKNKSLEYSFNVFIFFHFEWQFQK
ncbi:serine/threonine protein kinase SRPK1 [Trifolium medium]|uniref:Serine/threonine protein kinase SRPK1 n=1 Tax=Trifolium medium TaxID=97028 RepID=A0A392M725_9FABA|nr:serine/threonine protein kinase SRPK1 [Trifolium medium]